MQQFYFLVLDWNSVDVFEGQQYAVSSFATSWASADYVCANNNATLADVSSLEQNSFIRSTFIDTMSG